MIVLLGGRFVRNAFFCIIIIFACSLISACEKSVTDLTENNRPIYTESDGSANLVDNQNDNEAIKPLTIEDFSVSDGENTIVLDFPYLDFNINLIEEEADNNYVGEINSGEFVYKVYFHNYLSFDLYTSNINYNIKNRDFDEYYITQITLKTPSFKTYRGINLGSNTEELVNLYGLGKESIVDGNTVMVYSLKDMEMQFTIDDNNTVQIITLAVLPLFVENEEYKTPYQ